MKELNTLPLSCIISREPEDNTMPKYRALHLKIIDSFDFNEMPNDFFRVTWMLLTLIADSAGRGIDNAAWIRSKMYPLREDVTGTAITAAFPIAGAGVRRCSNGGRCRAAAG